MMRARYREIARLVLATATAIVSIVSAAPALAEPAFAVRTGYRCSQCHLNRTGGGLRTPFGSLYTQTTLPMSLLKWRESNNLLPANPEARFAIGADLRLQYLAVSSDDTEDVSSFEIPEANAYVEFRLLPGRLSAYLDETLGPGGASTRELFGLFSFRKWNGYVKFGKFLPPYGWRLPDDSAFIRQFTGFAYSAPDTGVEVGFEPGKWSLHLSVINGAAGGSDNDDEKKLTLLGIKRWRRARLGVSAANDISGSTTTSHAGILGGLNLGRLSLLAEGDWVETSAEPDTEQRLVGFFEADLLIARGINLKYAHDWLDPDRDVGTDEQTRDSLGIEFIPYPFVQVRWFVRVNDGPPQVQGSEDKQVDFEVHLFF
jgi:hypothetical protein